MCGIFGVWQRDGSQIELRKLNKATLRLHHRGPDDEGYLLVNTKQGRVEHCGGDDTDTQLNLPPLEIFLEESFDFAFGFRRLAILDLSPAGHQPMQGADGRNWIIFNGEVYNYLELRQELVAHGHTFRTGTDTEVILAAYQHWGPACLQRFNGMWALAIWDTTAQSLFLARDRFGVKPLYYTMHGGHFSFASEIKALVGSHGVSFRPNEKMIYRYILAGILPNPQQAETFFEGVFALPPGHQLIVTPTEMTIERYWKLNTKSAPISASAPADLVAAYRTQFTDAVRLRLRADVPVGTCLSGGLDSSSIVGTINQLLTTTGADGAGNFPNGRQQTFSAVYETAGRHNERVYIEKVLTHLPQVVGHFTFPTAERLQAELSQFVWHQDEPGLSSSPFAQWCVMQKAREQGITVLLDGQGADEALAGYRPFGVHLLQWLQPNQLGQLWQEMNLITDVTGLSKRGLLQQTLLATLSDEQFMGLRTLWWQLRSVTRLFQPTFAARWRQSIAEGYPYEHAADLNQHLQFRVLVGLPELLRYEDRNSMAHSIEARVPFLDYRLMEFTFQHTAHLRIREGWTKWVLRKAMEDVLPKEIVWRKDKIGFETPQRAWIEALMSTDWFADSARSGEFLDLPVVRRQLPTMLNERRPNRSLLWRLLNLEMWLQVWHNASAEHNLMAPVQGSLLVQS